MRACFAPDSHRFVARHCGMDGRLAKSAFNGLGNHPTRLRDQPARAFAGAGGVRACVQPAQHRRRLLFLLRAAAGPFRDRPELRTGRHLGVQSGALPAPDHDQCDPVAAGDRLRRIVRRRAPAGCACVADARHRRLGTRRRGRAPDPGLGCRQPDVQHGEGAVLLPADLDAVVRGRLHRLLALPHDQFRGVVAHATGRRRVPAREPAGADGGGPAVLRCRRRSSRTSCSTRWPTSSACTKRPRHGVAKCFRA